jgi:hypothetical protein
VKHLIGHTRNNIPVYVDLIHSKAAKNISRQPQLLTLAAEALEQITIRDSDSTFEHDMGRVIGYETIIKTTAAHTTFYAKLAKDTTYTHFAKHGEALPTSQLTVTVKQSSEDRGYTVHDMWIGTVHPPLPGSTEATATSIPYWTEHAFIFDNQPVQAQTITKTCPY